MRTPPEKITAGTVTELIRPRAARPDPSGQTVILQPASEIEMRPISWLWPGWLAAGKLHILGGDPGTGKTTLCLSVAATLSTGGLWPDGTACSTRRNVIIWSGEDSADDVLVPRLAAARADLSRVRIVSAVQAGGKQRPFDLATDMGALIEAARGIGDVGLLMIEPVVMSVRGDSHKNGEVRRGLQPIVDFAEKINAAALGITHFSKGTTGRDPLQRITDSLAFGAAPRVVWGAAKQFDDDGHEIGSVLTRVKSNIGVTGGGIQYAFGLQDVAPGIVASRVLWGATIEGSARELLKEPEWNKPEDSDHSGNAKRRVEAEAFLRELLKDGPRPVDAIREEAKGAGISWRTIERAKPNAGICSRKNGAAGCWEWMLEGGS